MVKYDNLKGLTDEEVVKSKRDNGTNGLPPPKIESFWEKLFENFEDPLIRILLVALVITWVLAFLGYADWIEGIGIGVAVLLATFVSTYAEFKNEASFRKLQEEASQTHNSVFRNGSPIDLSAEDIVVGDLVLLQAGDKIPADGVLISGELQVVQMTLNGEPMAVKKAVAPKGYQPKEKSDYLNEFLVFRGTVVEDGEAVLEVRDVGKNTTYGQLYEDLSQQDDRESPLQVKLSNLADGVATFGYIGSTAIAISFLFKQFVIDNGYSWDATMNYVSLNNWQVALHDVVNSIILAIIVIVVAVPEGLPMMIAIVLSLNMRKLLKAKVLVRKLLGIETAGSVNVLYVDKTGTLTRGVFEPKLFLSGGEYTYRSFDDIPVSLRNVLATALREGSSAIIGEKGKPVGGNASDRALLGFMDDKTLHQRTDSKVVREILFNSSRKYAATQLEFTSGKTGSWPPKSLTFVKGAPEILLPSCTQYYDENGKIQKFSDLDGVNRELDNIGKGGVRVIALATTDKPIESDKIPTPLTLIGIMGIYDDIRRESKSAVELAKRAGIQVVMITGDRKETGVAVAEELGLLQDNKMVLTSTQLRDMSDEQVKQIIPRIGVIARALPTDKSRLVRLTQELNLVVGMTGDGVNDSAALKKADVGFSMGSGSEVAKEASDIVILDDNFNSITQAILFGRTIFKSIRKFIVFQSTVNCASFIIVFLGPFLGFDFPLTLIQLLWVNLVMDTLAAMAYGGEPALKRYMHESPIKRDQPIISKNMWSAILSNGIFVATLCTIALKSPWVRTLFVRDGEPSEQVFLTAFFAFFIFLTNFNSFNVRTTSLNIVDHIWENQGFVAVIGLIFVIQVAFTYLGGPVLITVGLYPEEWILIIGASAIIIPFDMCRKFLLKTVFQGVVAKNE